MARLRHLLHIGILQHRVCMTWRDMLSHTAADGYFRRRKGLLQQLLRTRTTVSTNRQYAEMVEQEGSAEMAVVEMV